MGEWLFDYYLFLNKLHRDPIDIEDLVDGMTAINVIVSLENKA